ncbi:hypothetical protein GCM10007862_30630 [Dyella lipolytica]|nr:hypothetical protein GCM10007862_30630 [Dyella lipolytica]
MHAAGAQVANYYPNYASDTARITGAIDTSKRVSVGEKPQLAVSAQDTGALPSTQAIHNVTLLLKRSAAKQQQFDAYVHALSNPSSPYFHHWLTAAQIGSLFGPAQSDIDQVKQWLQAQGLQVTSVSPTGMMIHFSGNAATVGNAFHTSLHSYVVNGEKHFANNSAQQIPAALATVVTGATSLSNFFPKPQHIDVGAVSRDKQTGKWKTVAKASGSPQFTTPSQPPGQTAQTVYDVAPADFDAIYNVTPLWNASTPIRGAGQTLAVLERTDVLPNDVQGFRSVFLPANAAGTVSYIHPLKSASDTTCTDPGTNADESEAALDTEWVGAAAPDANIVFASCNDANSATFGPFTAAENLLTGYTTPVPAVFSLSYGECEVDGLMDGTAQEAATLWEQAAAQGVTVFVSTGDSGSAGCDDNRLVAHEGAAVNSMASTPFNVAVGGTDFNDFNNYSAYWNSNNSTLNQSAFGYIPEMTWNDTCASNVLYGLLGYSNGVQACNSSVGQNFLGTGGGSGGSSLIWSQPIWQTGINGSTNFGTRMLPDISLFAANGLYGHALIYCMSDASEVQQAGVTCSYNIPENVFFNSAGGTSFAAPAMAGIQALINQASGQNSGNILPALYNIAAKEYGTNASPNRSMLSTCNSGSSAGSSCVFNNVTVGNNDVPCAQGSNDCYTGPSVETYGVVSAGGSAELAPAWNANSGYSLATGLGSVNVTNLVNALTTFYKPFQNGYVAPYDFLAPTNGAEADGFSDIALVNPTTGVFTQLAMKGSVVLENVSQSVPAGYTIGAVGEFFAASAATNNTVGFKIGGLAWTGPDDQLWVYLSNGTGGANGYTYLKVGNPYAAGWTLVGAGNFDGSGSDELFWWNSSTGQIEWWDLTAPAAGTGFAAATPHAFTVATGYVPHLADVNGDGYVDIVWTNTSNNSVYVWTNNQHGSFTNTTIQNHPAGFTLFGAGDVTGTGRTALFWTNPAANQMMVWNMNGATIASQTTFNIAAGYTIASIADYNGDGLADILWVGTAGDVYDWFSDGNGSFYSQRVADAAGSPLVIPAGAQIQANRLQGGKAVTALNTSVGVSH